MLETPGMVPYWGGSVSFLKTELYSFSVFPSSLMSALLPELALVCTKEALTPWPVCCGRSFLPQVMDAVPKPQLSCSSGRKEKLCPAGSLPHLFPSMTREQLICTCANLHKFFHFRVAVTFYPYWQERVGFWGIGVAALSVSEVVKLDQVRTRTSPAQSCPIYGLCLAGPTAVETFLNH